MTAPMPVPDVERLVGFDTAGEPFISNGRVLRGIYRGNAATVRRVLQVCEENDLFAHGIVRTRELPENPHPRLDYEMVLEHDRIPFITYPHEWSASMFKEAALLHVALFERLQAHDLTLKDWTPLNILFSGTRPVFVDFPSIIPIEDLPLQTHLAGSTPPRWFGEKWDATAKAIYESYRLMFVPYFALPLAMMDRGLHGAARQRMYETTLNASESVITPGEAFGNSLMARIAYEIEDRLNRIALLEKGPRKTRFFRRVRRSIARRKAAMRGSAYSSYYEDKNEDFAATPGRGWTGKQHGVHRALSQLRPATVLDLGCNTGWFSMLAATHGASVVAVDLDEASIDRLFADARRQQAEILPLVANLIRPLPELAPRVYPEEPSSSLIGGGKPLISSPGERLQCEMLIALAVVHHLVLGQGHSFEEVADIFARLATKYLCVEFVDIDDRMITSDPGFFPAYAKDRERFGWYDRESFKRALSAHFPAIEEVESHPATRTLLICTRN